MTGRRRGRELAEQERDFTYRHRKVRERLPCRKAKNVVPRSPPSLPPLHLLPEVGNVVPGLSLLLLELLPRPRVYTFGYGHTSKQRSTPVGPYMHICGAGQLIDVYTNRQLYPERFWKSRRRRVATQSLLRSGTQPAMATLDRTQRRDSLRLRPCALTLSSGFILHRDGARNLRPDSSLFQGPTKQCQRSVPTFIAPRNKYISPAPTPRSTVSQQAKNNPYIFPFSRSLLALFFSSHPAFW